MIGILRMRNIEIVETIGSTRLIFLSFLIDITAGIFLYYSLPFLETNPNRFVIILLLVLLTFSLTLLFIILHVNRSLLGPVTIWGTDILSPKISNTDENISRFTRLTLRDCVPDKILHNKFKMSGFDMHFFTFYFPFLPSHVVIDHSVNYRDTSGYFTRKCLGQELPARDIQ
jgi:hypothetical protein